MRYRILADENVEQATIKHELSEYRDQSDVTLEYVSRNWL